MSGINRMTYQPTHTSNYMNQLDNVFEWIKNKNLNVDMSRYSRYKGYIDDFYSKDNLKEIVILDPKFNKLNEAAQECIQIVQVYEAFRNENSAGFNDRLKKVIAGQDFFNPENPEDQPRDFLYELLVASWFSSWGYDIDFEQLTDVVAKGDNVTIYIECKRIKSSKGLEKNFRKACKQLSRVADNSEHYGLVFIDIYNCVAKNIRDYEYENIYAMQRELNSVLENNFRKQNSKLIDKVLDENIENTLAVAFTTARCLWLSDVTPQFYRDYKIRASSKIADEKFDELKKIFESK
jgi:hypothetical protein